MRDAISGRQRRAPNSAPLSVARSKQGVPSSGHTLGTSSRPPHTTPRKSGSMSALTASCAGRSVVAGPASSARAEQPCRASSVGSLRVPSRRQQLQLGRPALSKGSRSVVRSALPGSWDQMAREEQQSKNWWQVRALNPSESRWGRPWSHIFLRTTLFHGASRTAWLRQQTLSRVLEASLVRMEQVSCENRSRQHAGDNPWRGRTTESSLTAPHFRPDCCRRNTRT